MPETLGAKAILCDIEGTTTSIEFVKEILFPYSLNHGKDYIASTWNTDETQKAIKALIKQSHIDLKNNIEGIILISEEETQKEKLIENIVHNFQIQVKNDLKVAPLKNLQGLIWEEGYKSGAVRGHVYNDVPKAFNNWHSQGIKLYIYSSGSVHAQKLIYGYSEQGSLLSFIEGHFDTKVGMKQEAKSYKNILDEIKSAAEDVIFFTDIVQEAHAAHKAGVRSILLDRPGNACIGEEDRKTFKVIKTFDEITVVLKE